MGGTISSQSGGGRPIKEIKDSLAAAKAKTPLDEMEITKLSDELSAALQRKEEIKTKLAELNGSEDSTAQIAALDTELQALVAGEPANNSSNSNEGREDADSNVATNENMNSRNKGGDEGAAGNKGGDEGAAGNKGGEDEELKKKLEKCKEQKPVDDASVEKAQERTKAEVPSFFSTFFGNWLSYDNWQSTDDEKSRDECKELLAKEASSASNGANGDESNNGTNATENGNAEGEGAANAANAESTEAKKKEGANAASAAGAEKKEGANAASAAGAEKKEGANAASAVITDKEAASGAEKKEAANSAEGASGEPKKGGRRYTHKNKRAIKV